MTAFEVKTSSASGLHNARHIARLREGLPPERSVGGAVFHTGPQRYGLGEGTEAVPIADLWG